MHTLLFLHTYLRAIVYNPPFQASLSLHICILFFQNAAAENRIASHTICIGFIQLNARINAHKLQSIFRKYDKQISNVNLHIVTGSVK